MINSEAIVHKVLGAFLLGLAKEHDLDGIVISNFGMRHFLKIKSLKWKRVTTIANDVREIFPFHKFLRYKSRYCHSLWLSRKDAAISVPRPKMNSKQVADLVLNDTGIKFGVLTSFVSFDDAVAYQQASSLGRKPEVKANVRLPVALKTENQVTDEEISAIIKAWSKGMKYEEIEDEFNLKPNRGMTAYRIINKWIASTAPAPAPAPTSIPAHLPTAPSTATTSSPATRYEGFRTTATAFSN